MSEYTVIESVSTELVRLLRESLVPGCIASAESIGFSNSMNARDFILNVILYNINFCNPADYGLNPVEYVTVVLKYMIVASANSQNYNKHADEQIMLGKVIQALGEAFAIFGPNRDEPPVGIVPDNVSDSERIRINHLEPALFYKASPVAISLKGGRTAARVIKVGSL